MAGYQDSRVSGKRIEGGRWKGISNIEKGMANGEGKKEVNGYQVNRKSGCRVSGQQGIRILEN